MSETRQFKFCANNLCLEFGRPVAVEAELCPTCSKSIFAVEEGVSIVDGNVIIGKIDRAHVPITNCPDCGTPAFERSDPPPCWNCKEEP